MNQDISDGFRATLGRRSATRAFAPRPVERELVREALRDAAHAPSNCNTQPWEVHVVSGAALQRLGAALEQQYPDGPRHPDFSFDALAYEGVLGERRADQGAKYYQSMGVTRDDVPARQRATARNLTFFGAPHAAFIFMPQIGDSVRVAADVGMFTQTFLLALAARGIASIPQTMLSLYPDVVRHELSLDADRRLLLGVSFGYAEEDAAVNDLRMPRDVDDFFTFHDA